MSLLSWIYRENLLDVITQRIARFVEKHDIIYLFVSGGKDSALLVLASSYLPDSLKRRLVVVYTELVENTHPMNVEQVYSLTKKLLPEALDNTIIVSARLAGTVKAMTARLAPPSFVHIRAWNHDYPNKTFLDTIEMLGLGVIRAEQARGPMSQRWCMLLFKHKWWQELKAPKRVRPLIVGVKSSDSYGRARRWRDADLSNPIKEFVCSDGITDAALAPILDLTSSEVEYLLRQYGVVLKTYELYGDSLNCMFCPFRSREKIPRCVDAMPLGFAKRLLATLKSLRSQSEFVKQVLSKWIPELEKKVGS